MEYRRLGGTGLKVPPTSLGTVNFGLQVDELTVLSLVRSAPEQ
jgi:aryl-alcohol dehydrogenase-like predicted oxidoreductase